MHIVIEVLGGSVGGLYKRFRPPPARPRRPTRLVYTVKFPVDKKIRFAYYYNS